MKNNNQINVLTPRSAKEAFGCPIQFDEQNFGDKLVGYVSTFAAGIVFTLLLLEIV